MAVVSKSARKGQADMLRRSTLVGCAKASGLPPHSLMQIMAVSEASLQILRASLALPFHKMARSSTSVTTVKLEVKQEGATHVSTCPYMAIRRRRPELPGDESEFTQLWEEYSQTFMRGRALRSAPKVCRLSEQYPEVWPGLQRMKRLYDEPGTPLRQRNTLLRHMLCVLRQIQYFEALGVVRKEPLPWLHDAIYIDLDNEPEVFEVTVLQDDHGFIDVDSCAPVDMGSLMKREVLNGPGDSPAWARRAECDQEPPLKQQKHVDTHRGVQAPSSAVAVAPIARVKLELPVTNTVPAEV